MTWGGSQTSGFHCAVHELAQPLPVEPGSAAEGAVSQLSPGAVLDRVCSYQSPTADPLSPPSPCGRALASVGMWHRDERESVDAGEVARVAGVEGQVVRHGDSSDQHVQGPRP